MLRLQVGERRISASYSASVISRLVENVVQMLVAAKLFAELLDFARGSFIGPHQL